MMTASPNRHYCEHCKAPEEGTLGKEIWRKKLESGILVQLEEDGSGSTRQNWMETSGSTISQVSRASCGGVRRYLMLIKSDVVRVVETVTVPNL